MSILSENCDRDNADALMSVLAHSWDCEMRSFEDEAPWEPDGLDRPDAWLPTDRWFDRQAETFESMGSDVADYAAGLLRRAAAEFRAMEADTVAQFKARSETYLEAA